MKESMWSIKNDPFIIIRNWQIQLTEGDHAAAAVLSFLCSWHETKTRNLPQIKAYNDVSQGHHEPRTQLETTVQWHTSNEIESGIMGLYSKGRIATAIDKLVALGIVEVFRNPNPRFKFDKTKHFKINEANIFDFMNAFEKAGKSEGSILVVPSAENIRPLDGNGHRLAGSGLAIPESSSESSSESTEPPISPLSGGVQMRANGEKEKPEGEKPTQEELPTTGGGLPQGNVSRRAKPAKPAVDQSQVLALYEAYPKHVARGAALKAIAKALAKVPFETLMESVNRYRKARAGQDPQFTKHPATFFNEECYFDDPTMWESNGNGAQRRQIAPGQAGTFQPRKPTVNELETLRRQLETQIERHRAGDPTYSEGCTPAEIAEARQLRRQLKAIEMRLVQAAAEIAGPV